MATVSVDGRGVLCDPGRGLIGAGRVLSAPGPSLPLDRTDRVTARIEVHRGTEWPEHIGTLIAQVRAKAFFMATGAPVSRRHLENGHEIIGRLARDGKRVRVLYANEALDSRARTVLQARRAEGVEFRVTDNPLVNGVLLDGSVAVLWESFPNSGAYASMVIREPSLFAVICRLGTAAWERAHSLDLYDRLRDGVLDPVARQVLASLVSGMTDENAAAELDMSVRTYRRHVAEIMKRLGARSRFQAGAVAGALGLVRLS